MPKGLHNPLPASLRCECKKARSILQSFIEPSIRGSPATEIPPRVLENAKGLVILTATKASFLGSIRFGSGIIVARLPNNSWSAPSAIATFGGGFGGQIGIELTDFVFLLNDAYAVRTFAQSGSVTLGGNVSVAVGPVGRNAELAGGVNASGAAAMFTYSKTKGLYGGVSVEGGIMVERQSANRKMYGFEVRAEELLGGLVQPREEVGPLMRILESEVFYPSARVNGKLLLEGPIHRGLPVPEQGQGQGQEQPQEQTRYQHQPPPPTDAATELPGNQPSPAELPSVPAVTQSEATNSPPFLVELPAEVPAHVVSREAEKPQ